MTESIGRFEASLLRVGGPSLEINALLNYSVKFPILMPKGNRFVSLFVQHLHRTNFHAGPRALVGKC